MNVFEALSKSIDVLTGAVEELKKARTYKYKKREWRGGKWIYWYRAPSGKLVEGKTPAMYRDVGGKAGKYTVGSDAWMARAVSDVKKKLGDKSNVKEAGKLISEIANKQLPKSLHISPGFAETMYTSYLKKEGGEKKSSGNPGIDKIKSMLEDGSIDDRNLKNLARRYGVNSSGSDRKELIKDTLAAMDKKDVKKSTLVLDGAIEQLGKSAKELQKAINIYVYEAPVGKERSVEIPATESPATNQPEVQRKGIAQKPADEIKTEEAAISKVADKRRKAEIAAVEG